MRRLALVVIAIAGAAAAAFVLLRSGEERGTAPARVDDLEPIVETPRPPVAAERVAVLHGRPSPRSAQPPGDRATVRARRNDLARAHRDLVRAYEAGLTSLRDVEQAEGELLDARHDVGELCDAAWHRGRAVLLERDAERFDLAVGAGLVPALDAERAHLRLERERFLAGGPSAYVAKRDAFLRGLREQGEARVAAGLVAETAAREEREAAEAAFPP